MSSKSVLLWTVLPLCTTAMSLDGVVDSVMIVDVIAGKNAGTARTTDGCACKLRGTIKKC